MSIAAGVINGMQQAKILFTTNNAAKTIAWYAYGKPQDIHQKATWPILIRMIELNLTKRNLSKYALWVKTL